MSDITLSAGVRANLLSLQNTADMMATTQTRLATGKSVNSALDNPTNFFTSEGLNARAGELNNLMDSIGNATKVLEAADNGIQAITDLVESAQSTVKQAQANNSDAARHAHSERLQHRYHRHHRNDHQGSRRSANLDRSGHDRRW